MKLFLLIWVRPSVLVVLYVLGLEPLARPPFDSLDVPRASRTVYLVALDHLPLILPMRPDLQLNLTPLYALVHYTKWKLLLDSSHASFNP